MLTAGPAIVGPPIPPGTNGHGPSATKHGSTPVEIIWSMEGDDPRRDPKKILNCYMLLCMINHFLGNY